MSGEKLYVAKSGDRYVREVHMGADTHNVVFCEAGELPLQAPQQHWRDVEARGAELELEAVS